MTCALPRFRRSYVELTEGRQSNLCPFESHAESVPWRSAPVGADRADQRRDPFRFSGSVAEASTKRAQTLVRHTPRDLQKASIVLHPAPRRTGEELDLCLGQLLHGP